MAEDSEHSGITINLSDRRPHFEEDTYSTLEVNSESCSTLQVAPHSTLEVYKRESELQQPYPDHPVTPKKDELTAAAPDQAEFAVAKSNPPLICGFPKKVFWIIAGIVTGILLLGAVIGGAVGGTLHRNSSSAVAPTVTSSAVAPIVTSPPAKPINTTNLLPGSSIASVNWLDATGATHYRVYFQDTNNSIIQSAWDSQNATWAASQILNATNNQIGNIKSASPIAAAIRPTSGSFEIQIYILTADNQLVYVTTNGSSDGPWTRGTFGNETIVTGTSTSLSAYWTYYQNYSNFITVLYQDPSETLQILNFTEKLNAWQGPSPLLTPGSPNPVNGTGLGLIAYAPSEQFRLYADYEGRIDQVAWFPPQWNLTIQSSPLQPIPANPKAITALQYNSDLQVLWTEATTGHINGSMYNISNGMWSYAPLDQIASEVKSQGGYRSLASNYDNRLYASFNLTTTGMIIEEWSFNPSTTTWSKIGLVNTEP